MIELNKSITKYNLRKEQEDAFSFFKESLQSDNKFILFELPTGVGKSVLTMLMSNYIFENYGSDTKIDVLTSSKLLQKQYKDEFSFLSNLWGKSEYKCSTLGGMYSCADAPDILSATKQSCDDCLYKKDRIKYVESDLSLTNYHMYCTLKKYTKTYKDRNAKYLILDEAHELEQIVSDFYTIDISESILKKFHFDESVSLKIKDDLSTMSNIEDLYKYISNNLSATIKNRFGELIAYISENNDGVDFEYKINTILKESNDDNGGMIDLLKNINDCASFMSKIEQFMLDYSKNKNNWVLDISNNKKNSFVYTIQPIWAYDYISELVWSNYDKVILMSGTVLNKDMFCYLNGIDTKKCSFHSIESPFPLENRPIYYIPIGKLSYKQKNEVFNDMKPILSRLLTKYKSKKGIIHTHSFEFSDKIRDSFPKEKRFLFHDNKNKNEQLRNHYLSPAPTILVSPSMTTGIDLQNERARFQIVLKVPYPSLASNKNKSRMNMNPKWYSYKTVSTIIQIYGRAVRSNSDYADCIILDECFSDLLRNAHEFIPNYVSNAIQKYNYKTL